jgi:hypothetical protein
MSHLSVLLTCWDVFLHLLERVHEINIAACRFENLHFVSLQFLVIADNVYIMLYISFDMISTSLVMRLNVLFFCSSKFCINYSWRWKCFFCSNPSCECRYECNKVSSHLQFRLHDIKCIYRSVTGIHFFLSLTNGQTICVKDPTLLFFWLFQLYFDRLLHLAISC